VRYRLRQALDVGSLDDVAPLLVRRPARVHVSSAAIDVSYSLAELPIEIRMSGLDRDPGWVPAAGRAIGFHFD